MRQSHTFLTAIALNSAFSLAACAGGHLGLGIFHLALLEHRCSCIY